MGMLTLDLSKRAGWAYGETWRGTPRMTVGSFRLPEGTHVERGMALADDLQRFLVGRPPLTMAGIEIPLHSTGNRTTSEPDGMGGKVVHIRANGGAEARILLWSLNLTANTVLHMHHIPVRQIGVKEWRKAMFGNGNIAGDESKRRSKSELIAYGIDVKNQDEAEAGMMLFWMNNRYQHLELELAEARRGRGGNLGWNLPAEVG